MKKFNAREHFSDFNQNLRTSDEQEETILKRVARITKIINSAYWNGAESRNSKLVGSYGRGTAISLSDVDLLVKLPNNQKQRFDEYLHNGQSALLQDVKSKLKETYALSEIKGDGQIVSIAFSDGIGFEILPAFSLLLGTGYEYPDTHNDGSWKETDPARDQMLLADKNKKYGGIVKQFAKMLRAWRNTNNVELSGIAIDVLVYKFIDVWSIVYPDSSGFDDMSRDFFEWLSEIVEHREGLLSLDQKYTISLDSSVGSKACTAWNRAKKAIQERFDEESAENEWAKIYGGRFPIYQTSQENEFDNNGIKNMSTKSTRVPIGTARDTEEFWEDKEWTISKYVKFIEINTNLEMNGFRTGSIRRLPKIPIKKNSKITFSVEPITGITWYWKVRNVGETANQRNLIRGQIIKKTNEIVEPIKFRGNHYVEVYGLSKNTVQYFGRVEVPLEGDFK